MHKEHHCWFSPTLGKHQDLLVYGHAGAKVIVFPSTRGRHWDWEDRGLIGELGEHVHRGWLQFYCLDNYDEWGWYGHHLPVGERCRGYQRYHDYLNNELYPLMEKKNPNPFVILTGASFGGFHALSFGLKYPQRVGRILAMSALCDITKFCYGFHNECVYLNNPMEFISNEHEPHRLDALRRLDIIMAVGATDYNVDQNRRLSGLLWSKGIGNALRVWDGFSHDWPHWKHMIRLYMGGHD
ncbi:MAG TPA: alpha/beta hydrolase-fold protein [Gemmatales bacterium]|nr:alpha/beta hydrolase-fold protein [Gemmatales bacterium]HMP60423.1 alpha/beta hydrolase-fold protein [Gemmatales bacterium]